MELLLSVNWVTASSDLAKKTEQESYWKQNDYQKNEQICFVGQLDECYVTLLSEYSDLNNSLMEAIKIFPILLHGNPCVQSVFSINGSILEIMLNKE